MILRSIFIVKVRIATDLDFVLVVVPLDHTEHHFDRVQFTLPTFTLNTDPTMVIQEVHSLLASVNVQTFVCLFLVEIFEKIG